MGQVTPVAELRTDPERVNCFSPALAAKMNTSGAGRPWKFSHFRKTDGYAAMPLDGVWLRAPYLHNGSVPTIRDLLEKPENRPSVFWRGYDVYDYKAWVSYGAARKPRLQAFATTPASEATATPATPMTQSLKRKTKKPCWSI